MSAQKTKKIPKRGANSSFRKEELAELKYLISLYKSSKLFKILFLANALEMVIAEAEMHTGEDFKWMSHELFIFSWAKFRTAENALINSVFIHGLVRHGASRIASFKVFSKWTKISVTKCRTAFHELQGLIKKHPRLADELPYDWEAIISKRPPFPNDDPRVMKAFEQFILEIKKTKKGY